MIANIARLGLLTLLIFTVPSWGILLLAFVLVCLALSDD